MSLIKISMWLGIALLALSAGCLMPVEGRDDDDGADDDDLAARFDESRFDEARFGP